MTSARVATLAALACLAATTAGAARADEPPPPSRAPVSLTVTPGPGGAWRVRVENTGELPVRVAADLSLLTLEIEPPADPKARRRGPTKVSCALPASARPDNDDDSALVVPGKRAWSAGFDPRLFCFGAKERAALTEGAKVTARFGFPKPRRAKAGAPETSPFAITPVGAAYGKLAPEKELTQAPFTLAAADLPQPPPAVPQAPPPDGAPTRLVLDMADYVDSQRGKGIGVTLTLANRGERNTTLSFRPGTITFDVDGPQGHVECDRPQKGGTPIRELYTRLGPGGRTALGVLVDVKCPPDTFVAPGIYRVIPILDTREADGFEAGLSTYNGEVRGAPSVVRVREWQRESARPRPQLD